MKYAIYVPCDQTISYLTGEGLNDTIRHPEAKLWDSREDAETKIQEWDAALPVEVRKRCSASLEEVPDEQEFRSREDTW